MYGILRTLVWKKKIENWGNIGEFFYIGNGFGNRPKNKPGKP